MRKAGNHVVQALDMLDVDRGGDVDPGDEQFGHVLPSFGMTASARVRMCQLVDENKPGSAFERGVDVELIELMPLMVDSMARQDFERFQQLRGFASPVRLRNAHHHVDAFRLPTRGIL